MAAAGKFGYVYALNRRDLSLAWSLRVAVGCVAPAADHEGFDSGLRLRYRSLHRQRDVDAHARLHCARSSDGCQRTLASRAQRRAWKFLTLKPARRCGTTSSTAPASPWSSMAWSIPPISTPTLSSGFPVRVSSHPPDGRSALSFGNDEHPEIHSPPHGRLAY